MDEIVLSFKTPSMQKIYLLLRSNKQTGPYTLEELLQLNLKPFDLVWVDGRSAAWQYPFEIPALKPYVPETPQADVPFQPVATSAMEEKIVQSANSTVQKQEAPKRVFVSVPKPYAAVAQKTYADHSAFMPPVEKPSYEAKEEAISTTPSYTQPSVSSQKPVEEEVIHTGYSRSLNEVEEDYTNWMYRQKTKKKSSVNAKDLVLTALVLIVIGGGYYVMSRPSITNSVLPSAKIIKPSSVQPMENAVTEPGQNIETISNQNASVTPEQTLVSNPSNIQPDHTVKNIKTKNPVIVSKAQTNSSFTSNLNGNYVWRDLYTITGSFTFNRFANPQGTVRSSLSMNIGLQARLLNKKLIATFNIIDPFAEQQNHSFTYGTNFNLENFNTTQTRNFRLTLGYSFRKSPKKKAASNQQLKNVLNKTSS